MPSHRISAPDQNATLKAPLAPPRGWVLIGAITGLSPVDCKARCKARQRAAAAGLHSSPSRRPPGKCPAPPRSERSCVVSSTATLLAERPAVRACRRSPSSPAGSSPSLQRPELPGRHAGGLAAAIRASRPGTAGGGGGGGGGSCLPLVLEIGRLPVHALRPLCCSPSRNPSTSVRHHPRPCLPAPTPLAAAAAPSQGGDHGGSGC